MAAAGCFPELWGNIPRKQRTGRIMVRAAYRQMREDRRRKELLAEVMCAPPEPRQASPEEGICALLQVQPEAFKGQTSARIIRTSERLRRKRKGPETQQTAQEERWWEPPHQSAPVQDVDLIYKEIMQDLESSTDDDGSCSSYSSRKKQRLECRGEDVLVYTNLAGFGNGEDGSPGLLGLDPVEITGGVAFMAEEADMPAQEEESSEEVTSCVSASIVKRKSMEDKSAGVANSQQGISP